ncbi:MAG: RNA polymerase sigma factor [Steroidobacteraceae bacterium]|nr:RNA polymerase sigma factor [Steroidobacteraceae bacterium]
MTALTADDASLVTRLRHGDAAAARELYERHGATLLRFGMAMSNSRQTSEDVVHDTFVELLRHPERFDPERGSVLAFLIGIARHRMARIARVSVRDAEVDPVAALEDENLLALEDAADALDRAKGIERVRAAIADLPRVHREVVALCDLEELPYATVADILGCPIGTVRSRLSRARALLARRLETYEDIDDEDRCAPRGETDVDGDALTLSCRGSIT